LEYERRSMMASTPEPFVVVAETATNRNYAVRPSDIRVGPGCLLSSFGAAEIEREAERLVQFFQRYGFWFGFRLEDLVLFYREQGWNECDVLCGLAKPWFHDLGGWVQPAKPYVVQDSSGLYFVTSLFIERCRAAADPTQFLAMMDTLVEKIGELMEGPAPEKLN